jgi:hypothetical protein
LHGKLEISNFIHSNNFFFFSLMMYTMNVSMNFTVAFEGFKVFPLNLRIADRWEMIQH